MLQVFKAKNQVIVLQLNFVEFLKQTNALVFQKRDIIELSFVHLIYSVSTFFSQATFKAENLVEQILAGTVSVSLEQMYSLSKIREREREREREMREQNEMEMRVIRVRMCVCECECVWVWVCVWVHVGASVNARRREREKM